MKQRLALVPPLGLLLLAAWCLAAANPAEPVAPTGKEWEQEQNLHLNKEAPRATFASFGSLESALKVLPENSAYWRSLDGPWKFYWSKRPEERPQDFFKPQYDVTGWKEIAVPSSWQCQGYDVPVYANQPYLFKRDWPRVMGEPPQRFTTFIHRNPVGSYRRDFEVPAEWDGRNVYVHFDGVDSFFYLWVNGRYVGFSKDSRTPAAFDITSCLVPGRNTLAVEVYRFSDGSYLECQDMWRLSGIFRSVSLYALPKTHIRDFFVRTEPAKEAQAEWKLSVEVELRNVSTATRAEGLTLGLHLFEADTGKPVPLPKLFSGALALDPRQSTPLLIETLCPKPRLWSAETPNLYTVVLELRDGQQRPLEFVSAQVGFRTVQIRDGVYLLNGQPVKFKGVNRHENFPDVGHAVTRAQMDLDLQRLKQANVNHVRTAHYPNDPYWYYLCNLHGIYVLDEANIESHGYYYGKDSLSHPKEWEAAHVARVMAMVERDKNHPCVVVWSLGNEAGPGANFVAAEKALKARDQSRPTHYERNNDIVDLGSNQYPDVGWVAQAAKGLRGIKYPFYISEYAHIMNNALGNLADYWEAIESSNKILGAAIWEWCDQGLYQTNAQGQRFVAYGGDFGDFPNDGQFIVKGVVFADRTPKPCYFEVKQVYQDIAVSAADLAAGQVEVFNKHFFKDLSEFEMTWELTQDGKALHGGNMPAPDVGPRQRAIVKVPFPVPAWEPGAEYHLRLGFRLRGNQPWATKGYEVAAGQVALKNPVTAKPALAAGTTVLPQLEEAADQVTVSGERFRAVFAPQTGALVKLAYRNREMLKQAIGLNTFRCPLNNDGWAMSRWFEQGWRQLTHTARDFRVERLADTVRVSATVVSEGQRAERCVDFGGNHTRVEPLAETPGTERVRFTTAVSWTVYPDGSIAYQAGIAPGGPVVVLPRVGVAMELPADLGHVTYFGRGPEENYPDRKTGSLVGQYTRSVSEMFNPYARPNDMANREEVRWLALRDEQGEGILFSTLGAVMSASALPWSASELLLANHPTELPRSERTVLTLDAAVLGMGGASCGPGPMERDILRSNRGYHLGFVIRPVEAGTDLDRAARVAAPAVGPVAAVAAKGKVVLTSATDGAVVHYQLEGGPDQVAREPITLQRGGRLTVWAEKTGLRASPRASFDFSGLPDTSGYSVRYVSSQQTGEGEAEHLYDGDPDTYWHTEWERTVTKHPHTVELDLGQVRSFKAIYYVPRQSSANGRIAQYRFSVSSDGTRWVTVAEGRFPNSSTRQLVPLKDPVQARFLQLTAVSEVSGQDFASAAEIGIVP
jgi:beta-galactosidase